MEQRLDCPACGGDSSDDRMAVKEHMFGSGEAFDYVRCASCGTWWLSELPRDMAVYYPSEYYSVSQDPEAVFGSRPTKSAVRAIARSIFSGEGRMAAGAGTLVRKREFHTLLSLFASVSRALPPGADAPRILDVGCGSGLLPFALGISGFSDVVGADPFIPTSRVLANNVRLIKADLPDVDGTFDLIMFHHSFEHLFDPVDTLIAARKRLEPAGRILIRMPTVTSEAFNSYRDEWVQMDAPRHVTIFSRKGMESLAQRSDLRVIEVRDDSTSFQFWGSEQVRLGIPLNGDRSYMIDPKKSPFPRRQVRAWDARARDLNRDGRGDQAAWILEATPVR